MLMQLVFAAGVNLFSVPGEDAIRARAARLSEKLSLVYFWLPERDGRGVGWGVDSCHGTDKHGCNTSV